MANLERQIIESQINEIVAQYEKTYNKKQPIQTTSLDNGQTKFEPEFLNHLPEGTRSKLQDLVKRLNAL